MNKIPKEQPIILFDGVCNFCSGIVLFTIRRDPEGIFKYAPLQSEAGQGLLRHFGLPTDDFNSFILVEGNKCYQKSTAILRIARRIEGLWPLLYLFVLFPRPVRDFIYDIVVKNRYKWFGKREECLIPTPEIRSRFLE
ncbi:MAG TPA: thiol-disulfide oxidoreductase DCC family protein [Thermodesulfobacteriota bacterium]|nr:thiol-disulfide oxidoreductase DCC family protein [Thermodesulfobacteriota bacterium]